MFLLHPFCWVFLIINVEFLSKVFFASIEMIIQFLLFDLYHIDWFVDIAPSLCIWNYSYLILVCDPFTVLLNLLCWYFEGFSIQFNQLYWSLIFFFFWSVSGFVIRLMLVLWNEFENFLFSFIFWNGLGKILTFL